jgi:hypothetical protein
MKKSELKKLIKEEIKSVLEAEDPSMSGLKKAMGFEKSSGEGNKMGLPLEKLPGYDTLDNGGQIMLPDTSDPDASVMISSKDRAKEWLDTFMKKYGVEGNTVRFKTIVKGKYDVINSKKFSDWRSGMLKYDRY